MVKNSSQLGSIFFLSFCYFQGTCTPLGPAYMYWGTVYLRFYIPVLYHAIMFLVKRKLAAKMKKYMLRGCQMDEKQAQSFMKGSNMTIAMASWIHFTYL